MPIRVTRVVLIPRADTVALAAAAIRLAGGRDAARVLDLCAGSGCVGLAVAANVPRCRVVAADKSAGALAVAQLNATQNGLESRVTCVAADALAPPPPALGEFDLIVCNPPYIPTAELDTLDISVRDYEPRLALDGGEDGLLFYRAVAGKWGGALRGDGFLLFECGAGQAADVRGILEKSGFGGVTVTRDTGGVDRVVVGQKCISDIHA
jgi:release factor glutamine methyltransferase